MGIQQALTSQYPKRQPAGPRPGSSASHLLFKVAPLFLIDQHQVEVITHGELLIDVPHRWSQLVASQKEPDGNGLPCKEHKTISTGRM